MFIVAYPEALKLNGKQSRKMVEETAKEKTRLTFVQAISLFRQKKGFEMVKTMHNLVSQHRAFPKPVSWELKDEIKKIYSLYVNYSQSEKLPYELAQTLGLSGCEARELEDTS